MSGIISSIKDAITGEHHSTEDTNTTATGAHHGTAEGVSDLDTSRNGGAYTSTHSKGVTGSGLTSDNRDYANTTGNMAGAHSSNIANKVDPRVDSDRDGSRNAGFTQTSGNRAGTTTGLHGSGLHGNSGAYPNTGTSGGLSSSTNAGPHDSNIANKIDPRVDSDLDGRGNRHGASTGGIYGASGSHATAGSGTAQNTAGPHNSDTANKLDPRVDSDLDGSKTVGGQRTHS